MLFGSVSRISVSPGSREDWEARTHLLSTNDDINDPDQPVTIVIESNRQSYIYYTEWFSKRSPYIMFIL